MTFEDLLEQYTNIAVMAASVTPAFVAGTAAGASMMVVVKRIQGMNEKERRNLWYNVALSFLVPFVMAVFHVIYTKNHPHIFALSFGGSLGGTFIALNWYRTIGPLGKKLTAHFIEHFIIPIKESYRKKDL